MSSFEATERLELSPSTARKPEELMPDDDRNDNAQPLPAGGTSPHEYDADAAGNDITAICPACSGSGIVYVAQAQSDQPTIFVWGDGLSEVEDAPAVSTGQWIVEFNQEPGPPKAG
jgi:hypothetical protein